MHRSHFFGKKKTFALYDCCDFFKMRQKGVSVRPLPTTKKNSTSHIHFGGGLGWEFTPYIYFLKKCPIATTLISIHIMYLCLYPLLHQSLFDLYWVIFIKNPMLKETTIIFQFIKYLQ